VKIMAKDLVRTRSQVTKFYQMKCQMQAVGLRLQTIKSTQAMTDAMKGASRAMKSMNAQVNAAGMAKILKDFEQESALMDDKQEMMDGTFAALTFFPLSPILSPLSLHPRAEPVRLPVGPFCCCV
jgi:division protein CdvB (Snf7/Vps24/ESCRT-III family)